MKESSEKEAAVDSRMETYRSWSRLISSIKRDMSMQMEATPAFTPLPC